MVNQPLFIYSSFITNFVVVASTVLTQKSRFSNVRVATLSGANNKLVVLCFLFECASFDSSHSMKNQAVKSIKQSASSRPDPPSSTFTPSHTGTLAAVSQPRRSGPDSSWTSSSQGHRPRNSFASREVSL